MTLIGYGIFVLNDSEKLFLRKKREHIQMFLEKKKKKNLFGRCVCVLKIKILAFFF